MVVVVDRESVIMLADVSVFIIFVVFVSVVTVVVVRLSVEVVVSVELSLQATNVPAIAKMAKNFFMFVLFVVKKKRMD